MKTLITALISILIINTSAIAGGSAKPKMYLLETTEGATIMGTVVSEDDKQVTLTTTSMGDVSINRDNIKTTKQIFLSADDSVYVKDNDSVNIFLLMGLTRESGHWNPKFITDLKKNIPKARIFFLDLPGSGKYVNDDASLSIKGLVDFMRPGVLEIMKQNKGKNIICATSLGGMVACE